MSSELLIGLFLFVLAAVSAVGYVFVLRPARNEGGAVTIVPPPVGINQPALPGAQGAFANIFRLLGEAVPGGVEPSRGGTA